MKKVHVIIELEELIPQDPEVFDNEETAGLRFEYLVTIPYKNGSGVGFRARNEGETWNNYVVAFQDWLETDDCRFDPAMDYEIHWYQNLEVKTSK